MSKHAPQHATNDSAAAPQPDGHVDIGADRIARVYAQAILEAADRRGCRGEVLQELGDIVREVMPRAPRAAAIFASARVSVEDKARLIEKMTAGRMLPTTVHSLHVLARHGRLDLLTAVVVAAERLAAEAEGRRPAVFTTALPLGAEEQARTVAEVERALAATLAPTFTVDPNIIGGLVVRIGDTVYDQSVATSLERLGERLKQRSIHEIQYRRDRLGSA
jgi:F-type H+-transporting ATPase subunit delta